MYLVEFVAAILQRHRHHQPALGVSEIAVDGNGRGVQNVHRYPFAVCGILHLKFDTRLRDGLARFSVRLDDLHLAVIGHILHDEIIGAVILTDEYVKGVACLVLVSAEGFHHHVFTVRQVLCAAISVLVRGNAVSLRFFRVFVAARRFQKYVEHDACQRLLHLRILRVYLRIGNIAMLHDLDAPLDDGVFYSSGNGIDCRFLSCVFDVDRVTLL